MCACVFVFQNISVQGLLLTDRIRVVAIAIEQPLQGVWSWPYFRYPTQFGGSPLERISFHGNCVTEIKRVECL